jgi:hypothetical protein
MSSGNSKVPVKRSRPVDSTKSPHHQVSNGEEAQAHTSPPHQASIDEEPLASTSPPHQPSPGKEAQVVTQPMSPASNRERFHASCMPNIITCDLSTVATQPGLKFSFVGIVLVVYPANSNPLRRHVLLGDGRGTVGITVWNANVNIFSSQSVGQLAQFTKVAMTCHNNTRGLVLNKDSTVTIAQSPIHFACDWWKNLTTAVPLQAIFFHDATENSIVNVAGILGSATTEEKTVRNAPMSLLTLRIVDRTGVVMIRSWTHSLSTFTNWIDKPLLIRRIRVTAFSTTKIGELLDGNNGSLFETQFDNRSDLDKFWTE